MTTERVTVGSVEIVSVADGVMRAQPSFIFAGIPPDLYKPALGDDLGEDGTFPVKFGSFGRLVLADGQRAWRPL